MPEQKSQQINIFKIQGNSPNFHSGGQIIRHGMPKPRHLGDPPLNPFQIGYSGGESSSFSVTWSRNTQCARHPDSNNKDEELDSANVRVSDDGKLMIRRGDLKRIAKDYVGREFEYEDVDLVEFSGVANLAGLSLPLGMSAKVPGQKNKKKLKPKFGQ